jgi:serine protease AprX
MAQGMSRKLCEDLMFGTGLVRRFTQDSPVLPDVWIEYSMSAMGGTDDERATAQTDQHDPHPPVRLLLTPFRETNTGLIAQKLRERLRRERQKKEWQQFGHHPDRPSRVIYNQSTVAAELYFEDVVRVVLPMTDWWQRIAKPSLLDRDIPSWVQLAKNPEMAERSSGATARTRPELIWMIRVVGVLALVHLNRPLPPGFNQQGVGNATDEAWTTVITTALDLTRNVESADKSARVYSVSLNRQAGPTIYRSALSVKADAARRLFAIDCSHLTWAVIDSGIDAEHPAFRLRQYKQRPDRAKLMTPSFTVDGDGQLQNNTRVKATYDFNGLHLLLDPAKPDELPERLLQRLEGPAGPALKKNLAQLYLNVEQGRPIDWMVVGPLLEVPHEKPGYYAPVHDHGTHVAGILAGDWRTYDGSVDFEDNLIGICPDLRLYDLRVLDDNGRGDEFAVMAALQLVRHLNGANEYMSIHGVNLSLSIPHDVSNYACGRTPVCDECERVVGSGIVVVTAAGNQGYRKIPAANGLMMELYSSSSITDPGNADLVITVGATHRYRPHMYGVSYFSSRGPTGDGRLKPDLVAPGEKISGPLPNDGFGVKDGTSMAAPHVSGAAALLMARHNELVGRPARIKQVLCSTATDLGRERYF